LDQNREPGSAIVFFETDDLDGLRAAISVRGGQPSDTVSVNWLKVRMFEVRDHDGHCLWFGRSYHVESSPRPQLMMQSIVPELPLDDVPAGVRHYRDVLGFQVNYEQDDIGVLDRDEVRVLLIARTPRHTGIGSAYLYVRDVDALHAELLKKGANIQGTPVSQPWGLREFSVLDREGNRLTFGKPFE
jgi:predicted enzyme related to lactoylglutathione lyase